MVAVGVGLAGALSLRQEVRLGVSDAFVIFRVTLANLTGEELQGVKYLRNANPTIDGPHIFGSHPVTRRIIASKVSASSRRVGCSTAATNAAGYTAVTRVLFSALAVSSRSATSLARAHAPRRCLDAPLFTSRRSRRGSFGEAVG